MPNLAILTANDKQIALPFILRKATLAKNI